MAADELLAGVVWGLVPFEIGPPLVVVEEDEEVDEDDDEKGAVDDVDEVEDWDFSEDA